VAEQRSDLYAELGVAPEASPVEITHAYRALLREHHPDTQTAGPPSPPERLRRIIAAYTVLRDPVRRAAYDAARVVAQPGAADDAGRTAGQPANPAGSAGAFRRPTRMGGRPAIWAGPVYWQAPPRAAPAGEEPDADDVVRDMVRTMWRLLGYRYFW
jgi:curved DNA-binding protein CbpA